MLQFRTRSAAYPQDSARRTCKRGLTRDRVLARAPRPRLLPRIGTEDYAEQNRTYGLATMEKRHVTLGPTAPSSSTTSPRAASSASSRSSTRRCTRSSRSSRSGAAAASSSPSRTAVPGWTCALTTSTTTSRRSRARTSPPRTSAPGTAPCSRRSGSRSRPCRRIEDRARTGDRAGGQGGRVLPGQHAGGVPRLVHRPARLRPLPRRHHDRRRARSASATSTSGEPATQGAVEEAVLDLLEESESPALEKVA